MQGLASPPHLEYFRLLLDLDQAGAMGFVETFLRERRDDVESLYMDVLMPALVHAGSEWEADRISVAHEHYISEVTRDLIHRQGPRLWQGVTLGSGAPIAVSCAAPDERHVLGLMMVADILRSSGFIVHMLGEGAPAAAVAGIVSQVEADLLAVSVGLPEHFDQARRLVDAGRAARPGLVVLAGGNAVRHDPDACPRLGADLAAADIRTLRSLLPGILDRIRASRG